MARSQYLFFEALRRMGTSLFNFFSRCEERGVLPRTAKWIKVSLLGSLVAGLTLLSAASVISCGETTCYAPAHPFIHDISVKPNPTNGADSVTVEADADLATAPEDIYVKSAQCFITCDSVLPDTVGMQAVDGKFDSSYEGLRARLYVGEMDSGHAKVLIRVFIDENQHAEETADLRITR